MKKTVNFILATILAFNILLSFAGVNLLIHNCHHCNSTEFFVFFEPDHDCCENHHNSNHKKDQSECCTLPIEANSSEGLCDNCCSTETEYVKADYKASVEKNITKIWVATTPIASVLIDVCCVDCVKEETAKFYYDKPPHKPTGKDFVIFSHNLKIC